MSTESAAVISQQLQGHSAIKPFKIWLHLPPLPQYHPRPQLHTHHHLLQSLGFFQQPLASLHDFVSVFFFLGYPSTASSSGLSPFLSFPPTLCFSNTALTQSHGLTQCMQHVLSLVIPSLHCEFLESRDFVHPVHGEQSPTHSRNPANICC